MAFFSGQKGTRRQRGFQPIAEINITPMVDVMLVLLVIFMVAAPLMNSGVTVDLPTSSAPPLTQTTPPIVITVTKAGELFLQNTPTTKATLGTDLEKLTRGDDNRQLYIRADKTLPYGEIVALMGEIRSMGFFKLALISEQVNSSRGKRR